MSDTARYTDMKNSGIKWLGYIPSEWDVSKIGSLYSLRNEKVSDKDYAPLSVTMKGIVPQLATVAKTDNGDNRKLVRKGDFVINSRSDRRGSCGISPIDGSVSLINTVLTPLEEMHPGYYNWLFHTSMFADEFFRCGHGIVDDLWTTRWQEMKQILVPVPPLYVQEKISSYLDRICTLIDSAINEALTTIDEYKAWKQSLISEVVTKGLSSNAQMRQISSLWIHHLPIGVELSRVGLHYDIILGKMLCPQALNATYTLERYYCAANVHFDGVDSSNLKEMWFNNDEKRRYLVKPGDLLVVEGGAGAGGCAVAPFVQNVYVQNSIMIVHPRRGRDVRYLKYLLEMLCSKGYIDFVCKKATIPHFTKEKLAAVPFPVFSAEDVKKMCDYLDFKYKRINDLIIEKQQLIADLNAYKNSLIYETVTRKRKVV